MHKLRLDIRPKHVVVALIAIVAIACGSIALIEFELRNMRLDLSGLAAGLNRTSALVSVATLKVPPCGSRFNRPPTGDPKQEATMAYVASVIDLYRMTFGKLPENITDLDKLPAFENADKLNGGQMKKACSIQQMNSNRSFVLGCSGKMPSVERLDSAFRNTIGERFVAVDGIEVLQVPLSGGCI